MISLEPFKGHALPIQIVTLMKISLQYLVFGCGGGDGCGGGLNKILSLNGRS